MSSVSFTDNFDRVLRRIAADQERAQKEAANQAAQRVRSHRNAPSNVPVRVQDGMVGVGNRQRYYVGFLEFGTRYMRPRPFVVESLLAEGQRFLAAMARAGS